MLVWLDVDGLVLQLVVSFAEDILVILLVRLLVLHVGVAELQLVVSLAEEDLLDLVLDLVLLERDMLDFGVMVVQLVMTEVVEPPLHDEQLIVVVVTLQMVVGLGTG